MKPLFHFADLWKCFVRLFKNVDRVNTEDGSAILMEDNLAIDGNLAVTGEVVAGAESEWQVFENIVDKDGHNRFVEGDVTTNEITGMTWGYSKWSLSGSHLMIVLCGKLDDETAMPWTGNAAEINVPTWVLSKIYPVVPNANYVDNKSFVAFNGDGSSTQYISAFLRVSDKLYIALSPLTATEDRYFRIQFDLLIDNA